jgi:hypothetical protein
VTKLLEERASGNRFLFDHQRCGVSKTSLNSCVTVVARASLAIEPEAAPSSIEVPVNDIDNSRKTALDRRER